MTNSEDRVNQNLKRLLPPPSMPIPPRASQNSRRLFLKAAGATGLLAASGGSAWAARLARPVGPYQSDAPEVAELKLGIIAVASCAPLVVAAERGFFKRHGLSVTIVKESGWAACRDKMVSGENQASHMKTAQPLGITLGAQGAEAVPMIAPLTLSRSGSAFMIARSLRDKLTRDPATWSNYNAELVKKGEALTIALPWFWGWHAMMWRYFLATGGINADKEFKMVSMPPAQMVQNMKVGSMQACGMVEPWGVRGVTADVSDILFYGHELWPDHPTKSLGLRADWAEKHPKTTQAMLRAVIEAARWCDDPANKADLAKLLATPSYLNVPVAQLETVFAGQLAWGDGRTEAAPQHAIHYARDSYPQAREFKWLLSQLSRWGFVAAELDYDALVEPILRTDLHDSAMTALGLDKFMRNDQPLTLWDGSVFEHQKAAEYADAFEIHNRQA